MGFFKSIVYQNKYIINITVPKKIYVSNFYLYMSNKMLFPICLHIICRL